MILYDDEGNEYDTDFLECGCADTFKKVSKLIGQVYDYDRENSEKVERILEAISYSNDIHQLEHKLRNI